MRCGGQLLQQEVVETVDRHLMPHHLVEGGQVDRDLRGAGPSILQNGAEQAAAAAVAVVAKAELLLGLGGERIGSPACCCGAIHFAPQDLAQGIDSEPGLADQLGLVPATGVGLPAVVIPGVQPHLVTGAVGVAHQGAQLSADRLAGPGGAGQQDIEPIQRCCVGTQHLEQEAGLEQAPQVAPHVVGTDRKEETPLHLMPVEQLQQAGNPVTGPPEGIDVDPQTHFSHARLLW